MLATIFSLQVTVMSGYMLSRFKGATNKIWFTAIYLFRTVPYITWVMPLYLLTQSLGLYDTYLGLLLPHVAVHVCFFSWVMKGFFDGVEPELEQAAYLDGCSHWGRSSASSSRRPCRGSWRSRSCAGCSRGTSSCSR